MPQALELTLSGEVHFNRQLTNVLQTAIQSISSRETLVMLTNFACTSLHSQSLYPCFAAYLNQISAAIDANNEAVRVSFSMNINPNEASTLKQELQDSLSKDEAKKQKWTTPGFRARSENIALLSRRIHFQQMVLHGLNEALNQRG